MAEVILIIEDERDLLATLAYNLEQAGYETLRATTGGEGLDLAGRHTPDLVLLDLMLPDMTGNEVCRRLRASAATQKIPVIMCTAKGEEIDRVVGFEVGADDYVVKPFSVRELLLRVRAVLRRVQGPREVVEEVVEFGCLRVDVPGHRVWVDDDEAHLTALEFRLLLTFYERRGRVQSRERLLQDVWGYSVDVTTRTVDTHVKRLREKLGAASRYVETVRGVGYRFRERPDAVL